jgi:pimeloyl-ACP methyl ester carboxylesterase
MPGEQMVRVSDEIELCYETFGDPSDPPLLLVMGLATQMLGWPDDFCRELAERGFHVVRFDNRDAGRSTHIKRRPAGFGKMVLRPRKAAYYTLTEMADDAAGLLKALDLAPAHVVGASMGGMIAQSLAARHPELVRSLTSIMSTTGRRWVGQPAARIYPLLASRPAGGREQAIARTMKVFGLIGSRGLPQDTDGIRDIAERSYDRDHDAGGPARQLAAILASGDRTREVRRIKAPTLVIHGSDDRMVAPSGGRATAKNVRGAELLEIDGMGHDLPRAAWPRIIDAIERHARRAAGAQEPAKAA